MSYNKQQWKDEIPDLAKPIKDSSGKQKTDPQTGRPLYELVQEGTRLTSQRLNYIEEGIEAAHEQANLNTTDIDAHKKDTVKHITAAERAEWKAKETPAGAQTKADSALSAAKTYADTALLAKADKSSTYSKTETDQRIQAVVGAAPDVLDTLKEIGDALNNDPNFAATVTNQLSGKVDKVSGKQLSTEDYSSAEKAKLAGLTPGAGAAGSATDTTIGNRTADPNTTSAYSLTGTITQWFSWIAKYFKAITGKANPFDTPDITLAATKMHVDDTTRHITAAERTAWNAMPGTADGKYTPKTDRNVANGVTALDANRLAVSDGNVLSSRISERVLGFSFSNSVANQRIDLFTTGALSGYIEVTVTASWNAVNAAGKMTKRFNVVAAAATTLNYQSTQYPEVTGLINQHISISDISWDATNSRWKISIEARHAPGAAIAFAVSVKHASPTAPPTWNLSAVYSGAAPTALPVAVQTIPDDTVLQSGQEFQKYAFTQSNGFANHMASGSLDDQTNPGDFYVGGAVTGKHASFTSGLVEVRRIVGGAAGVYQRATDFTTLRTFIRYLNASGTWLSWLEYEHSGKRNITGGYAGLDATAKIFDAQIPANISRLATALPSAANLNAVIDEGVYYCGANATAATILNMPPSIVGLAFGLRVTRTAGTAVNQQIICYSVGGTTAPKMYSRNYNSSGDTWSPWQEIETTASKGVANGYAGLDSNGFVSANNLPYGGVVNLLGDSGRFMGIDGDPRSLQITTSFANNSFLSPWNGTTVFSGGKFIHDNTTNGGTAGALTEDVTSLLTAMSLGGSRYGTEFYIASYTMGSGTANAGNVAGTYLMTVNSNFPATGVGKAYTVSFWVRVKTGTTISIPRDGRLSKNGVSTSANYISLTPADGWVHIEKTVHASNGYYNAAPGIAATAGSVVQIAMPVVVAGAIGVGVHTSPVMGSSLGFVPLSATSYTAADILLKLLTVDGVGSGLDADLHAGKNMGEIANGTLTYAGLTKGTAPALTASIAGGVITSLIAGDRISFKAHAATTGPVTLNVNGLGAKSIKKPNGNNPPLALGGVYTVVYDGTAFILQGEGGEYGTAEAAQVLSGYTVGRENGVVNGTIPNRTRAGDSLTYTTALSAKGDGFGSLVLEPQTGYYASGLNSGGFGTLLSVDPNYVPASILSTKTVFGVQGSVPVIAGVDVASGVGRWGNGDLAIYPLEGYRKGGMGAGEIKVTTAQLRSVEGNLAPNNIRNGVNVFGVTGTLVPGPTRRTVSTSGNVGAYANGGTILTIEPCPNGFAFVGTGTGLRMVGTSQIQLFDSEGNYFTFINNVVDNRTDVLSSFIIDPAANLLTWCVNGVINSQPISGNHLNVNSQLTLTIKGGSMGNTYNLQGTMLY
ncbi:pyocin knob domain-containing protein [Paenibacillus sp. FSL L8-0323]|uniref:pyocin knob domain-containing protein n=1 Tax=Paenibacillus sp. FSL L8-0323 TaxID=2975330 RepID=UPI0030F651F4